jgi:hypothetical protein
MAANTFTETTSKSWGSRLGESIKGILFGLVLFVAAFPLLFWNEGRSVKRAKALDEGSGAVVSVSADAVDASNEGKLVHMSGKATTSETLSDGQFGISTNALKMKRAVEMYQWEEKKHSDTKKKVGGSEETTTTYTYNKTWSDKVIDSSSFRDPAGHENPGAMPFDSMEWAAEKATIGAYTLSPSLLGMINRYDKISVTDSANVPEPLKSEMPLSSGMFYKGSPSAPTVGDVRVSFLAVYPCDISLVSRQVKDTFEPYTASNGGTIELLELGTSSAEAMFQKAKQSNILMTWLIRLGGFILMFIGLSLIAKPLSVMADVLPIAGTIVGAGTGFVAFAISLVCSLLTIAVAWIIYRPVIGIILIAVAGGAAFLVISKMKGKKPAV